MVPLRCPSCHHQWGYKGQRAYASCPNCKRSVKSGYKPTEYTQVQLPTTPQQLPSAQSPAETEEAVLRQVVAQLVEELRAVNQKREQEHKAVLSELAEVKEQQKYQGQELTEIKAQLQELTAEVKASWRTTQEPVPSRAAREEPSSNTTALEHKGAIDEGYTVTANKELENEPTLRAFREKFRTNVARFRRQTDIGYVWWVMGGPPLDTLPTGISKERFSETTDPDAGRVVADRIYRTGNTVRQLKDGVELRYIISRQGIETYIRDGLPNKDEYEAISPTWRASIEERAARIHRLIQFMEFDNFSLALSEENYNHQWWAVNQKSLLIKLFELGPGDPLTPSTFWSKLFNVEEGDKQERLVKWYTSKFTKLWDSLPAEATKGKIKEWLEGLLGEIGGVGSPSHKTFLFPSL